MAVELLHDGRVGDHDVVMLRGGREYVTCGLIKRR